MRTHIDAAAEKLRSSKHSFYRFVNPVTIGTVTAASIYPVTLNAARQFKFAVPLADRWLAVSKTFGSVPARVYFIVVGFSMGYGLSKGIGWLRTKLLEVLFRYQGWTNGHSVTTKVWSILVKLIRGPRPFSTHEFESVLPRQPLPDLDSTLDKWLGVARQLVNKDEFELTEEVVEEFRHKEGPRLQAYLRVRATKNINWLSDYWLAAAYLSSRDPIAVKSNYYQCSRMNHVTDQVTRGAGQLRQLIQFYELLSHDSFPSTLMQGLVPLCMNGFKYVFNCVRLPGEHMDSPAVFPGHAYIVVIRKGHYFKLDIYATQTTGQKSLLTTTELKNQLQKICQLADELEEELSVAALTSQNRAVWAKQREVLAEKNEVTLRTVEACAFVFSLDTDNPKDCNECCKMAMTGNGSNRWFDKCFTSIVYPEGTAAVNVEHSVIDATVFGAVAEYCVGGERYENGDIIPDPPSTPRTVSTPVRLHWDLSDVKEMISMAMKDFRQLADSIDLTVLHAPYSKGLMKKFRISPDGYLQMAVQLAYYRLHGEFVKTYEPSTGRLFALGRTETIHPISDDSKAWVHAMQPESTVDGAANIRLLKNAVSHQMSFRLSATQGHGCDRHLLGLYCASRELGMDIPKIFMDKAWRLPFKLSSSQTPTAVLSFKPDMDQKWWGGGFAPVCDEGYGVSYVFVGDENLNINITSWKSCKETDSTKFSKCLNDAMEDMKTLLSAK